MASDALQALPEWAGGELAFLGALPWQCPPWRGSSNCLADFEDSFESRSVWAAPILAFFGGGIVGHLCDGLFICSCWLRGSVVDS